MNVSLHFPNDQLHAIFAIVSMTSRVPGYFDPGTISLYASKEEAVENLNKIKKELLEFNIDVVKNDDYQFHYNQLDGELLIVHNIVEISPIFP